MSKQQPLNLTESIVAISDDLVLPFHTGQSGVSGRLIRLGPVVDEILNRHDYPAPVSVALGEAIALTALLGTALRQGFSVKKGGQASFRNAQIAKP